MFAGVAEAVLGRIGAEMSPVEVPAGARLFDEGDVGDAVYVVVSGRLHLESNGVVILSRGPGECVGEFALIDEGPRSAAAVADTDLTLLRWDRESFHAEFRHSPEVAGGIFRVLTRKLREDVSIQVGLAVEQERWERDQQLAREVQMGMLPPPELALPQVELAGGCQPAEAVGGDYYDYVALDGDRVALVIGDVTGHGFHSALFVAMAKSCLHTQAVIDYRPDHVMQAMRRVLSLALKKRLLMSFCYVLLDRRARRLEFANAGHPPPLLYSARSGRLDLLAPLDPILGVLGSDGPPFEHQTRTWEPGDLLLLYSDGLTEARGPDGSMFEQAGVEKALLASAGEAPPAVHEAVLRAAAEHCRTEPQRDDLTVVVARAR